MSTQPHPSEPAGSSRETLKSLAARYGYRNAPSGDREARYISIGLRATIRTVDGSEIDPVARIEDMSDTTIAFTAMGAIRVGQTIVIHFDDPAISLDAECKVIRVDRQMGGRIRVAANPVQTSG